LVFRFLIPIFIGGTAAIISTEFDFNLSANLYGGYCSLLVIFLLVWPDFLEPDKISPQFLNIKWKLYVLYILLFLLYFALGFLGAKTFVAILPLLSPLNDIIDWSSIVNNIIASLIFLLASSAGMKIYLKLFKE
jgi:hypothetical protein